MAGKSWSSSTTMLPCLLYSHGKDYRSKTLYNIPLSTHKSCSIFPQLKYKMVMASSHGWLILMTYKKETSPEDHCYSLWNPLTLESIHLPPLSLRPNHQVKSFILSSPPKGPHSKLFLFETTIPAIFSCKPSNVGEWIELRYDNLNINYHLHNPVSWNGIVFAVGRNKKVFRVEINNDNTIFLRPLPLIPASHSHFWHVSLVECCGDLYTVCYSTGCTVQGVGLKEIVAVNVYKLKFSDMMWVKVDNIDDHAFFLSKNHAISCPAADLSSFSALRNRVYFTLEDGENSCLYSYHVEDGTLTISCLFSNWPQMSISSIWATMPILGTNRAMVFAKEEERKGDEKKIFFPWTNLSMDLQTLIAEKLPLIDYMRLRDLYRMNGLIAPPIQRRSLHLVSPWLIFSPSGKNVCNFLDPTLNNGRYFVKTPELFQDPIVRSCKESWVLMTSSIPFGLSVFLFNPVTMATIQLPCLHVETAPMLAFGFSSSPYSNKKHCSVVCFKYVPHKIYFFATGLGMKKWSFFEFWNRDFRPNGNSPVFCNGAFYYSGKDARIGVLRIEEGGMITWDVLYVERRPENFHRNYLVECDGSLLSVFVGHSGEWVQVMKLSRRSYTWKTVYDLGKHVLYVSRLSTICKVAQVEGTDNRIYFERLHGKRAVYYSLNTQNFHIDDGQDSRTSYYNNNTSEPLLCAWIQPCWW